MAAIAGGSLGGGGFAPFSKADRNAFLAILGLAWMGIVLGFGGDIADHIAKHKPAYPLIVHVHAAAFVGWLLLFTNQVLMIRTGRIELHRKLGFAMLGLAAFMVVIGPATAIYMDHLGLSKPDSDPAFIAVQLTDILAFATLLAAGVLLRKDAAAHKRLMLLSLLYITDAGFARWLGPMVGPAIGNPFWSDFGGAYLGADLVILALGAYDLVTRRRLHPAYVLGVAWAATLEFTAVTLHLWPGFRPVALALVGGH